jgi:gliding motility-associated-like protein
MNNNFSNGTIGAGWTSTSANPVYTNPCGAGPNGPHLWVGATASTTRTLETVQYNVSMGGCTINWQMRYGPNGGASCESPDLPTEGVHLQYSINNGVSWTDFPGPNNNPIGPNTTTPPFVTTVPGTGGYWTPVSGNAATGPLYYWHEFESIVPPAASTTHTKFRWAQLATSTTGYDAWGIDEVQISCANSQIVIWSYGATGLTPSAAVTPTTSTSYIVMILDSLNNIALDTVNVTVIPNPQPDLGPDTSICIMPGNHAILDAGAGYDTYLWSNGSTLQTLTTSISGTYSVTVTNGNCMGTDEIVLSVFPTPAVDAGPDHEICIGESVNLNAVPTPNCTYLWSTGATQANISATPQADSLFIFTVFTSPSCYDSDTALVVVHPLPDVFAGNDTALCLYDTIQLSASNANSYQWNDGSPFATINVHPTTSTNYSVTGTDIYGCTNDDAVSVTVYPLPTISIQTDKEIYCFGDTIHLSASGADTYVWNNGMIGSEIIIDATGSRIVQVTGTDYHECVNNNDQIIKVEDCVKFYIPTAFSPNADGKNDVFSPNGILSGIIDYQLIIYDRYGKVVFTTTDFHHGWDGSIDGQIIASVYTYLVNFTTISGRVISNAGTVTLIQ